MSDTPGYGFIGPSHIDNLTKELAEAKAENERLRGLLERCRDDVFSFAAKWAMEYESRKEEDAVFTLMDEVEAAL